MPVVERWLGALHERNFRLYFLGQLTSAVGTGMTPVAISFAVLGLAGASASQVGYVLAAETIPLVVFLLIGGVAADRLGRRTVMLGADLLRALAQTTLACWILLGHPPFAAFLVLAALVGTGSAFFMPAVLGLIPEIVSTERLTQANALNGLTLSIGGIVGPAVAGVVVAVASPGWAILVDAGTYLVSVASLVALRLAPVVAKASESFFQQLRSGWTEFWSRTWLWAIVVLASVANMVVFAPFFVLGAVISKQSLGGATAWGTILGSQGVGAVVGGLAMLRIRFRRPLVVALLSLVVWAFPLLALAYTAPVSVIAAGAFLGGASFAVFSTQWDTTMQREVPADVISRVSAYDWFGSLVFLPLGYAIAGPISSVVGVTSVFVTGSLFMVLSVPVALMIPAVRRIRTPDRPPDQVLAREPDIADVPRLP